MSESAHIPLLEIQECCKNNVHATNELIRLQDIEIQWARMHAAPPIVSAQCDFNAMTWTFKIGNFAKVRAGKFVLHWIGPADE